MSTRRESGVTIYIQEELSDARLRCEELKNLVSRAMDLIHASDKSDHFYAVAGDIIYAVPDTLLKLERSLNAAAMAVDKIDYEDNRQVIRPEKVKQLERILDDIRIRMPRRTGGGK